MLTLWEIRKSVLNRSVALRCRRRRPSVVCSSAFTHRKHPAAAGKLFACLSTSGRKKVRKKFWKGKKNRNCFFFVCTAATPSYIVCCWLVTKLEKLFLLRVLGCWLTVVCLLVDVTQHPEPHRKQRHTSFVRRRVKLAFSHQPTTTESRHQRVGTKGDKWPRNGY